MFFLRFFFSPDCKGSEAVPQAQSDKEWSRGSRRNPEKREIAPKKINKKKLNCMIFIV